MSSGESRDGSKVKGPASYFPSIEAKYGRPIEEWKEIVRRHAGMKHMELVNMLKSEHGLGHGHANALVAHALAEKTQANVGSRQHLHTRRVQGCVAPSTSDASHPGSIDRRGAPTQVFKDQRSVSPTIRLLTSTRRSASASS